MIISVASLVLMQSASTIGLRAIILYAIVLLACMLSILWKSEVALYVLTVLLPLQTTRYHLHAFPLGANIVDLLILSALAGTVLRPPRKPSSRSSLLVFLLALSIFYYLSLWRGSFYLGVGMPLWFNDVRLVDYKNFIVMPLLAYTTYLVVHTRRQLIIVLFLLGFTALIVDYSYFKSSIGRDFNHYSEATRDAGALGYAGENGLASYLVEISSFMIPLVALRSWPAKALVIVMLAATFTCILFSYSREGYVALALALSFLAVVRVRWLIVPIICFALSWQALLPTAVRERIEMTYTHRDEGSNARLDASAQERIMLWNDAMVLFRENPIIGTGFRTYADMGRVGSYRDTHNYYLKMLVETGLVGLGLFLAELAGFFAAGMRLFRSKKDPLLSLVGLGFAAMMLSTAVVNFFGDRWMFIQVTSNTWILLGCVLRFQSSVSVPAVKERVERNGFVWSAPTPMRKSTRSLEPALSLPQQPWNGRTNQ